MRKAFLYLMLLISFVGISQDDAIISEIQKAQEELNEHYTNPETTILKEEDFKNFKGLEFYPISLKYRVEAAFIRTPDEKPFLMATTTDRLPEFVKYAEVHFTIDGEDLQLDLFKNMHPKSEEYSNYLFLPMTDLTSGDGSYGGGRYLDLLIPEEGIDTIILDFNKLYNPYCAYNEKYSCPIPPEQNDLPIRIEAGVKDFKKKY